MTNNLTCSQDYAAREYINDARDLAREYADGDESVYTPRITFEVIKDAEKSE